MSNSFNIRPARPEEAGLVLEFIQKLAVYEKCADEVVADEATVYHSLFVERSAEVVFAEEDGAVVGFALFFHNFSTFVVRGARNPVQLTEDAENAVGVDVFGCHIFGIKMIFLLYVGLIIFVDYNEQNEKSLNFVHYDERISRIGLCLSRLALLFPIFLNERSCTNYSFVLV